MPRNRTDILDCFRTIAIVAVILFHFFSLPGFNYPYRSSVNTFCLGKYGVEFFFIISGFVIAYTLENTSGLGNFLLKRWIRLYPSALFASTCTLMVLIAFGGSIKPLLTQYFTSLTLVGPNVLNPVFAHGKQVFSYIDFSLWSLWPEIQFYIIAAITFYLSKKQFIRNFSILAALVVLIFWLNSNIVAANYLHISNKGYFAVTLKTITNVFTITAFIQYFAAGVVFYEVYKLRQNKQKVKLSIAVLLAAFVTIQLYFTRALDPRLEVANVVTLLLFFTFIFFPRALAALNTKYVRLTGRSSYFLYLIHQAIGLTLIQKSASFFWSHTIFFPLTLAVFLIVVSIIYTDKIERPVIKWLRETLVKKKKDTIIRSEVADVVA